MVDVAAQNPMCAALSTKSDENAYLSALRTAFVKRIAYAKAVLKVDPESALKLLVAHFTCHMCSDGCVLVTVRHGEVLCAVCGSTTKPSYQTRHASPFAIWAKHTACFCPSRALPAVCWLGTDHPRELGIHQVLGSHCLWVVVTATGLVPLTTVVLTREL